MKKLIIFLLFLISLSANAATKHYALKGKLGKNISFRLDLEEDIYHGIVMGQTTYYRKNGKIAKIKVRGFRQKMENADENLRFFMLTEYNGTKICGNFVMTLEADDSFYRGSWVLGNREYEMNDMKLLPTDDAPTFFKPVDIENASGIYEFSYSSGKAAMPELSGTLQLYAYRDNIAYQVSQVSANTAGTIGTMAEIFKNRFYFSVDKASYDVFAFEDAVFVKRVNPQTGHPDSFGANAEIEGCYIATGISPKGKVKTLFDGEIAFGEKYKFSVFDLNALWMEAFGGETTFPDGIIMKDVNDDGIEEIIARYTENKTDKYEVAGNRYAIFTVNCGELKVVATAQDKLENLEIADGYVIKVTDLDGWQEVPGNVHRNETAARG